MQKAEATATPMRTMSVSQAGEFFGIGKKAAYRAVQRGDIPALKIGRLWRVPVAAAEAKLQRVVDAA